MPNHLHLFVCGGLEFRLGIWVRGLKRAIQLPRNGWQPGFFDHILRSDESSSQKWEYVKENPVRANLVTRSEDWPFQGDISLVDRE
jgi:putative transposase